MKGIFIGLLLCCSCILQAQSNAIQQALKSFDYESALNLISKEKRTPELDFLKAKCYKNIARYNEAIVLLEDLVRQDPSNIQAVNELADSYQLKGSLTKAKFYYFVALQSAPANRFAQLNYLNSTYKLKEWNKTLQMAHFMLQKDTLAALLPVMGDCFVQLSKMDSARYYFTKAMKYNPDDYNTLSRLAKIYLISGDYKALINSTNRYLLTDSSNQVINQYNGIGYSANQNYDRAIYRLDKLYQQGDNSFLTNYYLGSSYFATGDYISAYDHLDKAFCIDSTSQNLYYFLGKSAIYSGYRDKGIRILNAGLNKLIPKDSVLFNYYINIAHAYAVNRNYPEQIKYLKLCYKSNPDDKLALYTIAGIYDASLKDPEEALNYYNLFMATRPKTRINKPSDPQSASYYSAVEHRITELKDEQKTNKKAK